MEPQVWFGSLPRITKTIFTSAIGIAILLRCNTGAWGLVGVDWTMVAGRMQLWRLFSNFLVFGSLMASAWQIGLLSVEHGSHGASGGMHSRGFSAHDRRLTNFH